MDFYYCANIFLSLLYLLLIKSRVTIGNEYQDYETNLGTLFSNKIESLQGNLKEKESQIESNRIKLDEIMANSEGSITELKSEIQMIKFHILNVQHLIQGILASIESEKQEVHLFTEKNYSGIRYSLDITVVNLCINFGNAYIQDNSKSIVTHRCITLYDHANCDGDHGTYERPTMDFGIMNRRFTSYKLC